MMLGDEFAAQRLGNPFARREHRVHETALDLRDVGLRCSGSLGQLFLAESGCDSCFPYLFAVEDGASRLE
jgi:hypothetical protein